MKAKTAVLTALLLIFTASYSPAEEAVDLVVLMDNSESIFEYYDDIVDYVISYVIKDYVRFGDTFHLLSFSDKPNIEIAQKIRTDKDVKTVLGRLYLLMQIGKSTDIVSALGFMHQYMVSLPEPNRKVAVIITDGIHNPAKSSQYYGYDAAQVSSEIKSVARKMKAAGWTVLLIRVPFAGPGASGKPGSAEDEPVLSPESLLSDLSDGSGSKTVVFDPDNKERIAESTMELPRLVFPGHLGKRDYAMTVPLEVTNVSDSGIFLELESVNSGGRELLADKAFLTLAAKGKGTLRAPIRIDAAAKPGEIALDVSVSFANGIRAVPASGTIAFTLAPNPLSSLLNAGLPVVIFIVLLAGCIIAFVLVYVILRKSHRKADAVVVGTVAESYLNAKRPDVKKEVPGTKGESEYAASRFTVAADARKTKTSSGAEALAGGFQTRPDQAAQEGKPGIKGATARQKEEWKEGSKDLPYSSYDQVGVTSLKAELKSESGHEVPLWAQGERRKSKEELARERRLEREAKMKAATDEKILESDLKVRKQGAAQFILKIDEQNPNIGLRNVHRMTSGSKLSVGSGHADFLVFVVAVPSKLAEVFYDGENLTFIPVRKDFFPELTGTVENCLGKTIKAVTKNGFTLSISFEEYVNPAERMNKLLQCIELPGLESMWK